MANFYQQIDEEFGPEARNSIKEYATHNKKLGNMTVRKDFLIKCRRNGVFPTHIVNSFKCVFPLLEENSPYLNELNRHATRFKKAILNVEIKQTFYKIKQTKTYLTNIKTTICGRIPEQASSGFFRNQELFFERHVRYSMSKTERKYLAIVNRSAGSNSTNSIPSHNTKALYNNSGVTIPAQAEMLLSLGSKFALPYTDAREMPIYHLIADVEQVIQTNQNRETCDRNRCTIANQIQNYLHAERRGRKDSSSNFYRNATIETRKFLKQNPDIVVIEADKGNRTVVMKRSEYDQKLQAMIDDDVTYKKLSRDPTTSYQRENNQFAKRLADLKLIDRKMEMKLKTYTATAPRIYGAPKAHKEGLPLRPVVACMTSPSYELSKYVGTIIQKSIRSDYNVRDSFTFCEYINNVQLPPDYVLISLDVVSLFTCIPKELVMHDVIMQWNEIRQFTNINLDLFLEMTGFCIDSSYFQFKGQYYQQVFGTAMGNPLSPIIADLVMETLMTTVIRGISFPVPVIKKYVDDLVLAVPKGEIETVRNAFNQYHAKIQFTVEVEKDGRIPYLDLLLVRKPDQSIRTEWYMKPIASGRFLNYLSAHSMALKVNVAKNLIKRVSTFSTNVDQTTANRIIHTQLRQNDYPTSLINRLINRRNEHTPTQGTPSNSDNEEKRFRSIVNIGPLTQMIQRTLKTDYPEVVTCPKQRKTIKSIIPGVKDKLEVNQRSNVVYKIPCGDCEASYVGMTSCQLKDRLSGHRSTINKVRELREGGKDETDYEMARLKERTALLDHHITNNHQFQLDRVEVLDSTNKKQNLAILESCHILNTPHTVNKRTDTDNLSGTYAGVLHTVKTIQHTIQRPTR